MFKKFSEWLSALCDNIAETVKRAFGRRGTKVCSVCRRRVKLEASKTYIAKEPKAPLALGTADVFFTDAPCIARLQAKRIVGKYSDDED